jgi:poly(3-hydroxybutyrate) depolymerase
MQPIKAQVRDPRLDFFRGAAMFIIYIAHCRGNVLWNYIPARYGISDAANMFVFISGMTAAIAFGGTFIRQGWLIGTARIAYRCLQLYAAQIGMFLALAVLVVLGTHWYGDTNYVQVAQLERFFKDPADTLVGLVTLTYVPHYVDILPLYIVALAMVPAAMALARLDPKLVLGASVALYLATNYWGFDLPAHADNQVSWYFDPFAWQLIFFTGFALRRGWVKVPLDSKWLFWSSVAILLLGLAISLPAVFERVPPIDAVRRWIDHHSNKTFMDPLQYVHFLASAYVAVVLLKGRERVLLTAPLKPFVKCGQQALSIFVSGIILSEAGGMVFDHHGTGPLMQILVNAVSFAALIAIAYGVAWFKAAPWKRNVVVAVAAADLFLLVVGLPNRARADEAYTQHSIEWQGAKRSFLLHVPPQEGEGALPLVLAIHGYGDTARNFAEETHLAAAADAAEVMVAFPLSLDTRRGKQGFNAQICCGPALQSHRDDLGFALAVIDDIAAHRALDRSRVYATGISNGGMLTYQLGALHPERFAAIAVVSGAIGGTTPGGGSYLIPVPKWPLPVMIMHGIRDRVVLYDGGASPILAAPYQWKTSVADAVSFWAAADHCAEDHPASKRVSSALGATIYTDCAGGSAVRLWTIENGAHDWPGRIFPAPGGGTRTASAEIIDFFAAYRRGADGRLEHVSEASRAARQ